MQIALHLGAHCTHEDRLLNCLLMKKKRFCPMSEPLWRGLGAIGGLLGKRSRILMAPPLHLMRTKCCSMRLSRKMTLTGSFSATKVLSVFPHVFLMVVSFTHSSNSNTPVCAICFRKIRSKYSLGFATTLL